MPITIGIGNACMARRTHPVAPSTSIRTPVAMKAPITSAKVRWPSAGPTRTVPGMVQKNASGWRYAKQKAMLMSPLMKNAPNSHDARSASLSPPLVPVARITTTGPLAANRNATRPLAMLATVRSRKNPRAAASVGAGSMRSPLIPVRWSLCAGAITYSQMQRETEVSLPARPVVVERAASSTAGPRGATGRLSPCAGGRKIRQVAAEGALRRQPRRCQRKPNAATFAPGRIGVS